MFWDGQTWGVEVFLSYPGAGSVALEQNIIVREAANGLVTPVPLEWW